MWVGKAVIFRWSVVAVIVLAAMVWGYFIITGSSIKISSLPVYGMRNNDSTDHTIADFSLINQEGKIITQDDFKDKIYVADFFFTNCEGICPLMSKQMERIANRYEGVSNFRLLSHTVKPEEDSITVLKKYAEDHHAETSQWYFVTGSKKDINKLARISYIVGGTNGNDSADFVHTQYFTLIDTQKRIRGFYDGTDSLEVDKLIGDIAILLREK